MPTIHSLSRRLLVKLALSLSVVHALASAATAHEFWIAPSSFTPAIGQPFKLELFVGDGFPGERVARNNSKLERFEFFTPHAPANTPGAPIVGRDGDTTVGVARTDAPGTSVIVYRSKPSSVTLAPEKFEAYLKQKGLERISAKRQELGESDKPVTEQFSRAAKLVIRSGDAAGAGFNRATGLRLEIIPENDPTVLKPGDSLRVRVEWEGKSIEGVQVEAKCQADPKQHIIARTDKEGLVALPLAVAGMWVVDSVNMVDAPKDSGARWESVWASLCFRVEAKP